MKSVITFSLLALMAPTAMLFADDSDTHTAEDDVVQILTYDDDESFDPTTAMLLLSEPFGPAFIESLEVQPILDFADSYLGLPYRRGGKSPAGFDCSGFTSYVFSRFGYSLHPSSSAQYTQGRPVDISSVRPGDLLFFSGRRASRTRVGHVALVTDVDSAAGSVRFIHSAVGGGIRYDSYPEDPYYRQRFIGARRIINEADSAQQ